MIFKKITSRSLAITPSDEEREIVHYLLEMRLSISEFAELVGVGQEHIEFEENDNGLGLAGSFTLANREEIPVFFHIVEYEENPGHCLLQSDWAGLIAFRKLGLDDFITNYIPALSKQRITWVTEVEETNAALC